MKHDKINKRIFNREEKNRNEKKYQYEAKKMQFGGVVGAGKRGLRIFICKYES